MKLCTKCKASKPLEEFYKNVRSKDGLQHRCIVCVKACEKEAYGNDVRKEQIKSVNSKNSLRNQELFWQYLLRHPCVDCGESNPLTLEMDHVVRLNDGKVKRVSGMLHGGFAWRTIEAEIAKCEVRCASCHTIRTAEQNESWRWKRYLLSKEMNELIPIRDSV